MHLHKGNDQGHTSDRIEKRKKPANGGIQTHDLSVMRRVLYRCAINTAQWEQKVACSGFIRNKTNPDLFLINEISWRTIRLLMVQSNVEWRYVEILKVEDS